MSVITRRSTVGTVALIAALALTGCASGNGSGSGDESSSSTAASPTPTTTPTPTAAAAMRDLTFEAGAAVPATSLPAFGVEISALDGWEQTGEDTTKGSREFTNTDGSVATVTQQRITDLDPSSDDRTATEQLFAASGAPTDRLEEQLLPTAAGGRAQFLSVAGHETSGAWSATVARAFTKPGAALVVRVQTPSQEALRPRLHEILVHAQVALT